jgi:DNA-directed RNA polymerase specialized sigma24 family protein
MLQEDSRASFSATDWSLIASLKSTDPDEREEALSRLAEQYWPAVYAFLRRRRFDRASASEMTAAFFTEQIIRKDLLARADQHRGRLRALLCTALLNFVRDAVRKRKRQRDRFSLDAALLEQEESSAWRSAEEDPARAFDRRWATRTLENAIERCRDQYLSSGKEQEWLIFEARELLPCIHETDPPCIEVIADRFDLAHSGRVYAIISAVRKRLVSTLRTVVAETVEHPGDVQDEIDEIQVLLADGPAPRVPLRRQSCCDT